MGGWHFIPWNTQYLFGGLLAITITVLVFRRDPKALSYKYFLAFGLCLVVWMLSVFIGRNAPLLSSSTASYRIVNFSFLLTQPLLLLTILYIGSGRSIYYLTLVPILPLSFYFLIAAPFDVNWTDFGWANSLRRQIIPIAAPIVMSYSAAIIITLIVLIRKHKLLYLKRKYGFILAGFLVYVIPLTITNMIMWGNPDVPPFGGILLTIEFLFIAYAVSIRPDRIEFALSESVSGLAENWLRFLRRLRNVIPGSELGEDATLFNGFLNSIGFSDIMRYKNGRQILDTAQLVSIDMNEALDKSTNFIKEQERALQASKEYTDLFTELYRIMRKDSTEFANDWLNMMLRRHGGFLDKQGVLSAMPWGTKLPSIFKELQSGKVYLFKEEKPTQAYEKLKEALEYGFVGLCFTKLEPKKVRATYGVEKASLLWLTFQEIGMEDIVSPKDLERLSRLISTGIVDSSRVVFLLDCLDQIIFANSFEEARGLLRKMKKLCEENAATFLLSINAEMFKKEQMDAIEEDLG